MFVSPFGDGIVRKAEQSGLLDIKVHDIREYSHDRHCTVDDYPFGGGVGMLMKPEPVFEAVEAVRNSVGIDKSAPVVLMSPQGRRLKQDIVEELAEHNDLMLVCGRYGGIDDRVRQHLATDSISIGDYVLTGGELAAMVVIESVSRLISGVVGSVESTQGDSFTTGLLQHPQYTRPSEFRGWSVPDVLLSGDHAKIRKWRRQESLRRTFKCRPELLETCLLSEEDDRFIKSLRSVD